MINQEQWVIEHVPTGHYFATYKLMRYNFKLVCYHKVTKKLLHTYGVFESLKEVRRWAKEHGIDLGDPGPSPSLLSRWWERLGLPV